MKSECMEAKKTALDMARYFMDHGYKPETALGFAECLNIDNHDDIENAFDTVETSIKVALWDRLCSMIDQGKIVITRVQED